MMVVDTISVSYDSLEELMERQQVIERTITNYMEEKKKDYTGYNSTIKMTGDRFYLIVDLIKD